jgi:hypothetical protein
MKTESLWTLKIRKLVIGHWQGDYRKYLCIAKQSILSDTLFCVGATYLPGPLPAKYCGQKRA